MPTRFNCSNGHPVCVDFVAPEVLVPLRGPTSATQLHIPIRCDACGGDFPMSTQTIDVLRRSIAQVVNGEYD